MRAALEAKRKAAKLRVLQAFREGRKWQDVAAENGVPYSTAKRLIKRGTVEFKPRGGARLSLVKMTPQVVAKLLEYTAGGRRVSLERIREWLQTDLGVTVSSSTIHRTLQELQTPNTPYQQQRQRQIEMEEEEDEEEDDEELEKVWINSDANKEQRRAFAKSLSAHITAGDMVVYHDYTIFDASVSRMGARSRSSNSNAVQDTTANAVAQQPRCNNLHVHGAVSPGSGILLVNAQSAVATEEELARFLADLFAAAVNTDEYQELVVGKRVVIVTNFASEYSRVAWLAHQMIVDEGVFNSDLFVVLPMASYSPMLNPMMGCWEILQASMKHFLTVREHMFLVRGPYYDSAEAHRMAMLREAVITCAAVITQRVVWRQDRRCLRACLAAERGEDMELW